MATDSIVSAETSISPSTCSSWNHHMNSHQLNKTCLIFSQHDLMSSNLALPGFVVRLGTNELGTPGQEIWTLYEHSTQSCHKMILKKSSCNVLHPPACCFMVKSPSTRKRSPSRYACADRGWTAWTCDPHGIPNRMFIWKPRTGMGKDNPAIWKFPIVSMANSSTYRDNLQTFPTWTVL